MFLPSNLFPFLLSTPNGAGEAQGIVGRTPPQSATRTKSRQAKTPTQTCESMNTHCIPLKLFLSYFSLLSPKAVMLMPT